MQKVRRWRHFHPAVPGSAAVTLRCLTSPAVPGSAAVNARSTFYTLLPSLDLCPRLLQLLDFLSALLERRALRDYKPLRNLAGSAIS